MKMFHIHTRTCNSVFVVWAKTKDKKEHGAMGQVKNMMSLFA